MRIDPKVETATRKILGHAIRDESSEIANLIRELGETRYRECISLAVTIAGYIVVDVLGPDWPKEGGLRKMAEGAAKAQMDVALDESQLYDYLQKSAVGFQTLENVFPASEDMATLPLLMTASLLLSFCPRDKDQWQYLDGIENALELAESVDQSALPAMILRAHRLAADDSHPGRT